jgi:GxxExxY protein
LHESAYEEAFCIECANAGLYYERQQVFPIHYSVQYIGTYIADVVVDNTIIVELKSVRQLNPVLFTQFHDTKVEWKRFMNKKVR